MDLDRKVGNLETVGRQRVEIGSFLQVAVADLAARMVVPPGAIVP